VGLGYHHSMISGASTGPGRVLVLGGGPTGLGAAFRLMSAGHLDWALLEAAPHVGGLASSVVDEQGYTWDLGGHVLFSHYEDFDRLMDELLGDGWIEHQRESWVWMRSRFVPYPLQRNVWRLPEEDVERCLAGLRKLAASRASGEPPRNLHQWLLKTFGEGLCEIFMEPYNQKVWAYPPSALNAEWMGERIAPLDLETLETSIRLARDEVDWGPNARFRFPRAHGTGAIWTALHARLPKEKIRLDTAVRTICLEEKYVITEAGEKLSYDSLISTIPLDLFLSRCEKQDPITRRASELVHSSSHIIGIGMEGTTPPALATKCWTYFPEEDCPFYRVTVFSNYAPGNVPDPQRHWSLLCEVSESAQHPVDQRAVIDQTIRGLKNVGFIDESTKIKSRWHRRLEHGYPTPFVGRDPLLREIDAYLMRAQVYSRGRFGGWKYEVSNQDHSYMQGQEAVDHILCGAPETTYYSPETINSGKKISRRPLPRARSTG